MNKQPRIYWLGELSLLRLTHLCVTVSLVVHAVHDHRRHVELRTEIVRHEMWGRSEAGRIGSGLEEIWLLLRQLGEWTEELNRQAGGE